MAGRITLRIENGVVAAAILPGGGHIAGLEFIGGPARGINPLWQVPWPSMEPSQFREARDLDLYGGPPEGRLLASIMGHNLCLDYFGPPSASEEDAGLTVHGEAGVAEWQVFSQAPDKIVLMVALDYAGLAVAREYRLVAGAPTLVVETQVKNLRNASREIGWQEHPTFGPPFLEPGVTTFDASVAKAATYPVPFAARHRLAFGKEFTWPMAPGADGKPVDLRVFGAGEPYGDFTAQLMDKADWCWFAGHHPKLGLACAYAWSFADYPWLGMWDEHLDRLTKPWSGRTEARGMEFGMSPYAMGRQAMRDLGSLFGTPVLMTIPAQGTVTKRFQVTLTAGPSAGPVRPAIVL